ncbi:SIR2 family NAD-dependent protein deacylase [Aeromonas caviae]
MDPYYELAYALESKSLCLFVGTGFSMHLSDEKAPSWIGLLKECAKKLDDGEELCKQLFPNSSPIMPLEECASIIQVKMHYHGLCLHSEIAKIIDKVKLGKNAKVTKDFVNKFLDLKFVTTNYDRLIDRELLKEEDRTTYGGGFPINRQPRGVQIYHIHGSVKYPKKMVVTADDYFRFINSPDYFSNKVQTLIEENTTVIIGYSLGDVNFKSILNKFRMNRHHDINRQNLFFLSRKKVDKHVRDYYDRSYGLRVIDETSVDDFFNNVSEKHESIKGRVNKSRDLLFPVLEKKKKFTDVYLKKKESFFEIVATLSSNAVLVSHPDVIQFLKDILQRKNNFTNEDGAWSQYEHLASWLVHLGCIMDISSTPLRDTYLDAVEKSFKNMSKRKVLGRSWDAFWAWKNGWFNLTYENRFMISQHFDRDERSEDMNEVMNQ